MIYNNNKIWAIHSRSRRKSKIKLMAIRDPNLAHISIITLHKWFIAYYNMLVSRYKAIFKCLCICQQFLTSPVR